MFFSDKPSYGGTFDKYRGQRALPPVYSRFPDGSMGRSKADTANFLGKCDAAQEAIFNRTIALSRLDVNRDPYGPRPDRWDYLSLKMCEAMHSHV